MAKDYYSILGVGKDAKADDIKKAYKTLAKKYHPDMNKAKDAEDKFKEINEAYAILGNEKKREQYDRFGTSEDMGQGFDPSQFGDFNFDFGDVFDQFFGGMGASRGRSRRRRGADLVFDMEITLEDVAKGANKKFTVKKADKCDTCGGLGGKEEDIERCKECGGAGQVQVQRRTPFGIFASTMTCKVCKGQGQSFTHVCKSCEGEGRVMRNRTLEIKVPAGIEDDMKLRIAGEGEAGERGTDAGDLYVIVHVKPHKMFVRRQDDLRLKAPLQFVTAALGGELKVPTIYDEEITISIPAGTSSGTVFNVKGEGLPRLSGYGKGDMQVEVFIDVPKKLSKKQVDLLKEFSSGESKKKGWWG